MKKCGHHSINDKDKTGVLKLMLRSSRFVYLCALWAQINLNPRTTFCMRINQQTLANRSRIVDSPLSRSNIYVSVVLNDRVRD